VKEKGKTKKGRRRRHRLSKRLKVKKNV